MNTDRDNVTKWLGTITQFKPTLRARSSMQSDGGCDMMKVESSCVLSCFLQTALNGILDPSSYIALGFCDFETQDTEHGLYNWTETTVEDSSTLQCALACNETAQRGTAERQCGSQGQWQNYYGEDCTTRTTFEFCTIVKEVRWWSVSKLGPKSDVRVVHAQSMSLTVLKYIHC